MIAYLNLRHTVHERTAAVEEGLRRCGYAVLQAAELHKLPGPRDVLVTWNRIREGHTLAKVFEREACNVLVMENASFGNGFNGQRWYHFGLNYHNVTGRSPAGDHERWDSLGVELAPWRAGGETVILPSRGIGPSVIAMPADWARHALRIYGGRIRPHPGRGPEPVPLHQDLARAGRVVTWGSGAAIKALIWGIPVVSELSGWIGECEPTDGSRLAMFRRLAWAQWRLEEISDGTAFAHYRDWQGWCR